MPRSIREPRSSAPRRRLWERLEERVLFDAETGEILAIDLPEESGDSVAATSFDVHPEIQTAYANASPDEQLAQPIAVSTVSEANQIVFVDITVDDFETLIGDIDSDGGGLDIVFLHPQRDGLQQIAEALNGRDALDAIHVISHASEGRLHLGGSQISSTDLELMYTNELGVIGRSLSADGDILLYGCELSSDENPDGLSETFATTLARMTGADVAASDDITGNVQSGGDWDLETHVGLIETRTLWVTSSGSIWQGTLAPVPEVSIDVPAEEFINEGFGFSVTFENTSTTPSDVGYAPHVDLHVPAGVEITGAAIFGGNLTPVEAGVFNADGDLTDGLGAVITHPVTGLPVTGNEGDSLLVYQLPFGSFVPGQPDATIDFSADLVKADGAVVGSPLDLSATGFFALGSTPQDEATGDPPIIGAAATSSITPTVWDVVKESDASEGERSTGPNYPITFTVTLDIANGETVDNVVLEDLLPPSWVYVANSAMVTSALPSTVTEPIAGSPQYSPASQLSVSFGSVTGTTAVEAVVTYQAWISDEDANSANVIDPVTGGFTNATNDSRATGVYEGTPIVDDDVSTDVTISQESLSIQKSIVVPGSGNTRLEDATPGDTVEYVLNIQVSDYFEFGDLIIDDNFSDGQTFDAGYGITYTINEEGVSSSGSFLATQFSVTPRSPADPLNPLPGEGDTDVQINLSSVISDGVLTGDLFDDPDLDGATTVQVRFRTVIQEEFRHDFPSGDRSVDTGDILRNNVTITGRNLDGTDDTNLVQDGGATSFSITGPVIEKTVYAIDGDPLRSNEPITAGHTITYRLRFQTSTADFENLVLTDFLPLPIYDATEIIGFATGAGSSTPPAAGFFSYGPDHTFDAVTFNAPDPLDPPLTVNPPTLTTSSDSNSVQFNFGSFDADNSGAEVIDLLFTVTATDLRFADGLLLTNQANATYGLTNSTPASSNAIAQNLVAAPELNITKGVVSTNGVSPTFSQTASPSPFTSPGTTGVPFTGSITSASLDTTPIDANLSDVDGGDLVRIAIVIENTGNADGFDLGIVDSLLPQYAVPPGGHNVQVHRGNGDPLAFTGDLFSGGIEVTDPAADDGALNNEADGAGDGSNLIVITYDVELSDTVETNQLYETTATITDYGAVDNGANHTTGLPVEELSDDASIQVQNAALSKSIVSTSESHTGFLGGIERVAIGETVRYRLVMEVPEGTTPDLILSDRLRNGLQFIDDGTATVALISNGGLSSNDGTASLPLAIDGGAALSGSAVVAPTFILQDANIGSSTSLTTDVDAYGSGTDVQFKLGTIVNSDDDANVEFVVVEFNAVVLNISGNNAGRTLQNDVRASIDPSTSGGRVVLGTSAQANVRVVEPRIDDLQISVSPGNADAGDRVFYEVTFSNDNTNATADAFDLRLTDVLPSDVTLDLGSINIVDAGTVTGIVDNSSGNTVDISIGSVAKGGSVTVTFEATLDQSVQPGETISTPAVLTFTSLPGSGSATTSPTSATPGVSGASDGERTGVGGVNDHRDTDADSFTITQPGIVKSLFSTSIDNANNANDQAVIGELVTYELVLTIPEGTMNDAIVIDTLESGLVFETLDSVIIDGAIARTPSTAVSPGVSGQQVRFALGDLSNTDRDADGETIVIRYTARVENVATNQGENAGTELSNAARLTWDVDGSVRTTATQTVDINVIEPDLNLDFTALPNPIDSGDTVTFQLVVSHTGVSDTDAFDVLLSHALPPELGNVTLVSANHSVLGDLSSEFSYSGVTNTVATNDADGFDLAIGETLTLVVTAQVNQASNPGQTLTSDANIQWSSLDGIIGTERTGTGGVDDYRVDEAVMLTVSDPVTSKILLSTSVNTPNNDGLTEATIGELIRYRVSVRIPESTIDTARIIDTLDEGLEFVSLDSVRTLSNGVPTTLVSLTTPSGPTAATVTGNRTQLTFDFGQIVNTDNQNGNAESLEIEYTVRVANITANQENDLLGNDALFTWTRGGVADLTLPASAADVLLLEPTLTIQHDISSPSGDASDAVVYTSTISHAASSDTDAYDAIYVGTLPTDFIPASFSVIHSVDGDISSRFQIVGDELRSITNGDFDLGLAENVVIEISGTIDSDVQPNDVLESDATVTWTSLDGNAIERTGDDGEPTSATAPLNNYAASDNASFTVDAIQLSKTLVGTSINDISNSSDEVVIGELVQYSLEVTLPEGVANSVFVNDLMDAGLEFVSLDSIVVTGSISSSISPFATVSAFDPATSIDGGTGGQRLQFNLGNLTNLSSTPTAETILIRYTARVTNTAGNTSSGAATGTTLDNIASATYDHRGTAETTADASAQSVEVIEPTLVVTTSISDDTPHLGQTVTYTTRIRHAAGSDATAHNVSLVDDLPPGMTLQGVSVSGATIFNNASTSDTVDLQFEELVDGQEAVVTYTVLITSDPNAIGDSLPTTPAIEWTSLPDGTFAGGPAERDGDGGNLGQDDYSASAAESATITHPLLEVTQTTVATAPAFGTPGNFLITYDLTLTNTGNDPLSQLTLQEDFRSQFGTGFVQVVGTPTMITQNATNPIEANGGFNGIGDVNLIDNSGSNTNQLLAGQSATIRLVVEVDPDDPGALLTNGDFIAQADATGFGQFSGLTAVDLSDDPGNVANVELDTVPDTEPDDPNTHRFPLLTVVKDIVSPAQIAASGIQGNYDVTYRIVVENDGTTPLENLTLVEDLESQFGDSFVGLVGTPMLTSTSTSPPGRNLAFTGQTGSAQLFDSTSSRLEINETVTITFVVEVDADAPGGLRDAASGGLDNQAVGTAVDPANPTTTLEDRSDDTNNGTDVDPNNDNNPDDPTRLLIPNLVVIKDTIGGPVPAVSGTPGNYQATFEITLTNEGNETLETLSLIQNFQTDWGGAFEGIVGTPVVLAGSTATDTPELLGTYDGQTGSSELFDNTTGTSRLAAGESVTIRLTAEFDPNAPGAAIDSGNLSSQSVGSGLGVVSNTVADDLSDDPDDPTESDPDMDIDTDDPNLLRVPLVALAKGVVGTPSPAASGTQGNFDVTYEFMVENQGTTPLTNLSLLEDLQTQFGGALIRIVGNPVIDTTGLTNPPALNLGYTGRGVDINLLDSSIASRLEVNESFSVTLVVELDPDQPATVLDSITGDGNHDFENQARVVGFDPNAPTVEVDDLSNDPTSIGTRDTDNDNDLDNPTVVNLPSITLTKTQVGVIRPATSGTAGNFDVTYDLQLTNDGNEPLETLRLIEDLQAQFGGAFVRVVPQGVFPATIQASDADDVPEINTAYTGSPTGSTNLFSNSGVDQNLLDSGQSVTVRLIVEFDADAPGGNRVNGSFVTLADVYGTGTESTVEVTDRSDDPVVVDGVNIYMDNDPDDPNFIRVPDVTLTKVILGTPAAAASGVVGNFDVDYEFVVQNTGTTPLENLSVIDEWQAQFGGAFRRIVPGSLTVTNIDITNPADVPAENGAYTGAAGQSLLDGTGTLSSGNRFRINVTVEVDPNAIGAIRQIGELVNQAVVSANDPITPGIPVTDLSDDTNDPTNADGDPVDPSDDDNNPDDPTGFGFTDIGLSKRILSATRSTTTPGAMTFTYELVIRNVGSSDLTNLTLTDDLHAGLQNAYVNVVTPPMIITSNAQQNPTLNPGFDGNLNNAGDSAIFNGNDGLIRPTEEIVITYSVDVHPDQLETVSNNQGVVGGQNPNDLEIVSDQSDTGTNPEDTNPGPQNDTGGEDDATLIPGLAIAKDHGDPVQGSININEWTVPVTLRVENTGSLVLSGLVLQEDIAAQFGSGFISSTLPAIDSSGVTHTDRPSINAGWVDNSSLNMLAGGSLNPGDVFTVTFDVIIDPDRSGASSTVTNQSTIEGFDPNDPLIGAFDESDSGSATDSENPGEPGDRGTTDDPTPLQIAQIGAAKRVTNVELVGLTALVTIEMTVENTGTVYLQNLDLFDDLADQFGDNFGRISSPPTIARSNADSDPDLNANYSIDTTENIFDGASGTLAPGQEITIRMVVQVTATPGQSTVTLENQTNVAGDPVDAAGSPILNQAGVPIPRVTDLSDSGADASSNNPGAPGDSGGFDDPTPTEITFFTFDNLNNFSTPFGSQTEDNDRPSNRLLTKEISSLAPDPLFSGAARPGTKIVARLYDSNGFQIGSEEVYADVGGNWMMQVHNLDNQDYTRVVFEEVSGSIETFAPSGDPYGYLGQDQHRNQYTALEPWAGYGHEYDFTAIYRGSARQALARAHRQATRSQGFGV